MPTGPGLSWVKRTFIDPAPTGGEWRVEQTDGDFIVRAFVPARLEDNKYLGSDYHRKLMQLPERLRDAIRYGKWDVFEGQYFDNFDPVRHVLVRPVEAWHLKMCGIDHGYTAPLVCLWGAVDEKGRVHIYRELYETGLIDEEAAKRMNFLSTGENVSIYKADPSCWNKRSDTGMSISERWSVFGLNACRASNERVPGWNVVRAMLEKDIDGIPALTISPLCKNLIRELSEAVSDKNNPEDLDTHCSEHACDGLRYLLADYRGFLAKPKSAENRNIVDAVLQARYAESRSDWSGHVREMEVSH